MDPGIKSCLSALLVTVTGLWLSACGGGGATDSVFPANLPEPASASQGVEPTPDTSQEALPEPAPEATPENTIDVTVESPVEVLPIESNSQNPDNPPVLAPAEALAPEIEIPQAPNNPDEALPTIVVATQLYATTLDEALLAGEANNFTVAELIDEATLSANADISHCAAALGSIYKNGIDAATMPYLSTTVYSRTRNNYPLHVNQSNGDVYSWIGAKGASRYAYMGASIFQLSDSTYWGNLGDSLAGNTLEVLAWLFASDEILEEPITILTMDSRSKYQMMAWLTFHDYSNNWIITDDQTLLETGEYDLLAGLNNRDTAGKSVKRALENQSHIFLWSEIFDPGSSIHALGLSWNWWGGSDIGGLASVSRQCELAHPSHEQLLSFQSMAQASFDYTYNDEICPTHTNKTQCQAGSLLNSQGGSLQETYLSGLESIRKSLEILDFEDRNVFEQDDTFRLTKLAVLVGDKQRDEVRYPMDKKTTDSALFYGALFADYTNHYARNSSPAQIDSGNFSKSASKIQQMDAQPSSMAFAISDQAGWSSTGTTAKPGNALTLTRTDDNPESIAVRFNMQRSQSTWIWNENGYSRPKFLASNPVALAAGQSITISSPVGGPVYVYLPAQSGDISAFNIEIAGGVQHPMLDTSSDSNLQEFTQQISQQDFDWVDIKTPYVEVHSLTEHMQTTIASGLAQTPGATAEDIIELWVDELDNFLIQSNLSLAGFSGEGLPSINTNVMNFCNRFNLNCNDPDIHRKPPRQHIVADYNASCGDFCSGNPFDLNRAVIPLGFGESHEMGHNLQRHRLNFYGTRSLETSNNVFPYYVAFSWMLQQELSVHPTRILPSSVKTYAALQKNIANKAIANIGHPIWHDAGTYDNWDVRLGLYLQLVFIHDQWESSTENGGSGWDLLTKLYLLERQVSASLIDESSWAISKTDLGFSEFDYDQAKSMSGNDFMAIALSHISSNDHRSYLDLWGIQLSSEAQSQIEINGYNAEVPSIFWIYSPEYLPAVIPSTDPLNARALDGVSLY
jgi:hypothetical protein